MTPHRPFTQTHHLHALPLIAAAVCFAALIAACGGGGDKPTPTATIALPTQAPTLAASPVATATPQPTTQEYTVAAGDTLTAIAEKFGVTTDAIISANSIANPDFIQPGDTLTIPAP
jgi:LysM repeat protein